MKQTNISVFIPHTGCKNLCSFCNQRTISGCQTPVTVNELHKTLSFQLDNLRAKQIKAQIAFFGGSFTAIDRGYMTELLDCACGFVKTYPDVYAGIRCSTRPDCIDAEVLEILKSRCVMAIELGAQSMNDEVLAANQRGHTAKDVEVSSRLIKQYGFELGLQMMTGLYRDTPQYCIDTAKRFIELGCDTVRIYPTVILKGTELDRLHSMGVYDSFDFDTTVELCAQLLEMFGRVDIPVIRMGLHASKDVENSMTGGVYHPALRELAESRIYLKKLLSLCSEAGKYIIYTDKRNISKLLGQSGKNRSELLKRGITFKLKEENGTEIRVERIG